jgi:hypothetical protein
MLGLLPLYAVWPRPWISHIMLHQSHTIPPLPHARLQLNPTCAVILLVAVLMVSMSMSMVVVVGAVTVVVVA